MAHTKVTKAYSANTGVANTYSYSGSFDVFKATEVVALLDNVALTYTASTINESASPREYTVDVTAKTIHIGGADLSSGTIIIRPVTDMGAPTPRATYAPGASITSADLNNNQKQLMRKAMEYDEQKLASTGGTMTGHLTMGEDTTIIFEGATDDAYETTLTVTDPTADRTITIPNVTGTVVTTGDTATVTATMLAANSVDSSELVDGSIDASHIASSAVTTAKIAADAVTGAKIADDAIDSEHYTDGSIDTAHIGAAQVTTAKLADDAVTTAKITDGNVTTAKIAADAITAAKIADDVINSEHYAADSIDAEHYAPGSVDATALASSAVTTAKINADAVTGAKIADDTIDSEHYVAASIDNEHLADDAVGADELAANAVVNASIASGAAIAHSKLANVTDGQILVGNGSNVPTAVAVSGDVTIANTGAVTIANDAVEIAMIGCEQTTISDSDSHIPTSGAVVDYVAAQIAPIGGLEVIADDESFPNTIPAAGVVISITDAAGLQINSSGVSTNGDTLDNSTVTINGFPSALRGGVGSNADPYVLGSGSGLMVQSTGSSQTYNYHKALLKESDYVQLSDDINDFNSKYRIASSAPGSDNDEGDLYFNTSTNKMNVYDGSAWGEVTSTGDFKFLVPVDAGTTTAASWDGSDTSFDLKETTNTGSAASVTNVNQLIVSLNGVIQKPNTGTYSGSEEGFYLTDSDTIRFCTAPPAGSVAFILQCGSAVSIPTPGDGTVSAAKIASGAVTTAKIGADAVDGTKIADDAINSEHYTDGSIDTAHIAADQITGALIADDAVGAEHIEDLDANVKWVDSAKAIFGTGNDMAIYHNGTDAMIDAEESGDTRDLYIKAGDGAGADPGTVQILANDGNKLLRATNDAGVELFFDNTLKLNVKTDQIETRDDIVPNVDSTDSIGTNAKRYANGYFDTLYGDGSNLTGISGGVSSDGSGNTHAGTDAGNSDNYSSALNNSAFGHDALTNLTTGDQNTAIGDSALFTNVSGSNSTAVGWKAGYASTAGENTYVGVKAGEDTTGECNVFLGSNAGAQYTTAFGGVGIGYKAFGGASDSACNGASSVFIGYGAGEKVTSGGNNTVIGYEAGHKLTTSGSNTIIGKGAGQEAAASFEKNILVGYHCAQDITDGTGNVFVGPHIQEGSGDNNCHDYNTAIGYASLYDIAHGTGNTAAGQSAGADITTGNNNTCIGKDSGLSSSPSGTITTGADIICLGNNSVSDLYCADTSITSSDSRDKTDIADFSHGLEWVNKLRPVTYRWDKRTWYDTEDIDDNGKRTVTSGTPDGSLKRPKKHIGFLAQEVLAIEQADGFAGSKDDMLVVNLTPDDSAYGLKYERMVPILVNAIKELSTEVNTLKTKVAALEAG